MDEFDQSRQAPHQLRQCARDLDVAVTLSPQPHLGDVAVDLAQQLPGPSPPDDWLRAALDAEVVRMSESGVRAGRDPGEGRPLARA
ncbi:hypothetical protein [Streptomyces caniferus]|uniref:hypothetical protein n=1 Tax=Streptomyces caniferus TaxID=285557 RepID=UPI0037F73E86